MMLLASCNLAHVFDVVDYLTGCKHCWFFIKLNYHSGMTMGIHVPCRIPIRSNSFPVRCQLVVVSVVMFISAPSPPPPPPSLQFPSETEMNG